MKSQSTEQLEAQAFDSYAKKTIKGAARDFYRNTKRRTEHEALFSELSDTELAELSADDEYFMDEGLFVVLDQQVCINVPELAEAISMIDTGLRDILLLYFYFRMSDRKIAKHLEISTSTVTYRRKSSLKKLKKILEENAYE